MAILDELKAKANGAADTANNIQEAVSMMEFGSGSVSPEDVSSAVAVYLDEHLTNPTNPPIDTSLTIEGAAADAKKTGYELSTIKEDFNDVKSGFSSFAGFSSKELTLSGFIKLNGSPVNLTPTANAHNKCGYWVCESGDVFIISGTTGTSSSARLWAILDSDLNVLSVAKERDIADDLKITIPTNGAYFVVNQSDYFGTVSVQSQNKSALSVVNNAKVTAKNVVYVSPEMFGALGDGVADDYEAIQQAVNYAISNNVAMRAFGHYRILSPISIVGSNYNIYIHYLDYRGSRDAAIVLSGSNGYLRIDYLYAFFSSGAALRMETTPDYNCEYNELHFGTIIGKTNAIECLNVYAESDKGNKHFYYNRVYIQKILSDTGNCIYLSATGQFSENSFWGKHVANRNGYFIYCEPNGLAFTRNYFYEFTIEAESKDGVFGSVTLINCRTRECEDKGGMIFTFDNVLPSGRARNTEIALNSIDVSNALTLDNCLAIVKEKYESGMSATLSFDQAFPRNLDFVIAKTTRLLTYVEGYSDGADNTVSGTIFAYLNHKGFIPDNDWAHDITSSEYITFDTDKCIPTIFNIKANTTIHLDDSYCAIGIKSIQIVQTDSEKAKVYDHNNILVFDGEITGAGTYRLYCELLAPESITVETSRGTITRSSRALRGQYFGDNEKWMVEKLNTVS